MMAYRFFLIVLLSTVLFAARNAGAQPADLGKYSNFTPFQEKWLTTEPRDPSLEWLIAYGGRLYDNWIEVIGRGAPKGNHPMYPRAGKQTGPNTWRCKECHGWDYNGKDGAYAKGSHYTGIKGIRGFAGKDPKAVVEILRDKIHRLDDHMLPKYAAERLALFVTRGQIKPESYVNADGSPKGDVNKGRAVFQNVCAVCHGYDGKSINFGSGNEPEYIGTVANKNIPEMLHKMRNGNPGAIMLPQISMDIQQLMDIAAYARYLPQK